MEAMTLQDKVEEVIQVHSHLKIDNRIAKKRWEEITLRTSIKEIFKIEIFKGDADSIPAIRVYLTKTGYFTLWPRNYQEIKVYLGKGMLKYFRNKHLMELI